MSRELPGPENFQPAWSGESLLWQQSCRSCRRRPHWHQKNSSPTPCPQEAAKRGHRPQEAAKRGHLRKKPAGEIPSARGNGRTRKKKRRAGEICGTVRSEQGPRRARQSQEQGQGLEIGVSLCRSRRQADLLGTTSRDGVQMQPAESVASLVKADVRVCLRMVIRS